MPEAKQLDFYDRYKDFPPPQAEQNLFPDRGELGSPSLDKLALEKLLSEAEFAHDMRSYLNIIILNTRDLLDSPNIIQNERDRLNRILVSANDQLELVNRMLDIVKSGNGEILEYRQKVNLSEFLIETASLFETLAIEKGLDLRIEESTLNSELSFLSDKTTLRRILNNLITNAVRYTNKGEIVIGLINEPPQHIGFYVKDTGVGINENTRTRIFDKFSQTGHAIGAEKEGTGQGLHIVKILVEELAGEIKLESQVDIGTTFTILLPHDNMDNLNDNKYIYEFKLEDYPDSFNNETVEELIKIYTICNPDEIKTALDKLDKKKTIVRKIIELSNSYAYNKVIEILEQWKILVNS